jgi:predicted methyltransferase
MHGAQYVDPAKRDLPQTYYTAPTAIARTIDYLHRSRGDIRMGVVGLGIGTLAAYAQGGDHFVFYEINPNVVMLARKYFTYMSQGGDRVDEVVLGDARISLDRHAPEHFDAMLSAAMPSRSIC